MHGGEPTLELHDAVSRIAQRQGMDMNHPATAHYSIAVPPKRGVFGPAYSREAIHVVSGPDSSHRIVIHVEPAYAEYYLGDLTTTDPIEEELLARFAQGQLGEVSIDDYL